MTAAFFVFAASVALVAAPGCVPQPSRVAEAKVVVDIYSGRENPSAPLGEESAGDLRAFIEEHEQDAESTAAPEGQLGFRGLIVTFAGDDPAWTSVRILEDAVFIEDEEGSRVIVDDEGRAFAIVWNDIQDELDPAVVREVEDSR